MVLFLFFSCSRFTNKPAIVITEDSLTRKKISDSLQIMDADYFLAYQESAEKFSDISFRYIFSLLRSSAELETNYKKADSLSAALLGISDTGRLGKLPATEQTKSIINPAFRTALKTFREFITNYKIKAPEKLSDDPLYLNYVQKHLELTTILQQSYPQIVKLNPDPITRVDDKIAVMLYVFSQESLDNIDIVFLKSFTDENENANSVRELIRKQEADFSSYQVPPRISFLSSNFRIYADGLNEFTDACSKFRNSRRNNKSAEKYFEVFINSRRNIYSLRGSAGSLIGR